MGHAGQVICQLLGLSRSTDQNDFGLWTALFKRAAQIGQNQEQIFESGAHEVGVQSGDPFIRCVRNVKPALIRALNVLENFAKQKGFPRKVGAGNFDDIFSREI